MNRRPDTAQRPAAAPDATAPATERPSPRAAAAPAVSGTIPVAAAAPAPTTCVDAEPFALRVTDDSMAPEFPAGCIVVVDPSVPPQDGRFVVAETADGHLLRRLRADGGGWRLECVDAGRGAPVAVAASALRGAVTQRAGRRRRDRKRYP